MPKPLASSVRTMSVKKNALAAEKLHQGHRTRDGGANPFAAVTPTSIRHNHVGYNVWRNSASRITREQPETTLRRSKLVLTRYVTQAPRAAALPQIARVDSAEWANARRTRRATGWAARGATHPPRPLATAPFYPPVKTRCRPTKLVRWRMASRVVPANTAILLESATVTTRL
jgi:hypothetical protein